MDFEGEALRYDLLACDTFKSLRRFEIGETVYKAFNLNDVNIEQEENYSFYYNQGLALFKDQKSTIQLEIDQYFNSEGELEAEDIMGDWFPEVKADIFLSHSHADEKDVIALAGLLKHRFGLTTFIDSTVWGYANKLLQKFDDKYCRSEHGATYDYQKRNISTTHVHLMLSIALMSMMDKTEAVFFYNTPNSVSLSQDVENATNSPWIFSEISMTRMVRARSKNDHRVLLKAAVESISPTMDSVPSVKYPLDLGHLIKLNASRFKDWTDEAELKKARGKQALDVLYNQAGVRDE